MKQKVISRLQRLNAKLDAALADLGKHDQEQLERKPGPGQWSAMDALHHIRLAEMYAHKYVKKKLSFKPEIAKTGIGTAVRTFLMGTFFKLPIKRQAPDAVNTGSFPEGMDFETLSQTWKAQRQELLDYIREMDDHWFEKEVYKHPFAGRLGMQGMLTFFETHFDRHLKQAKRAVK